MNQSLPPPKVFSNAEWEIRTSRTPILSSAEIDSATENIGIPMPEMIFGNNYVHLIHKPTNWSIQFNTLPALELVDKTGERDGLVQVAYSKAWQKSREKTSESEDVQGIIKPYDWTYTTAYKGDELPHPQHSFEEDASAEIPFDKLKLPDPIIFFDDIMLYEDELGDNGIVSLRIKIRVMADRLLLLSRLFLRVDDVLFRVRDTRVFVEFNEGLVIREYQEREEPYATVRKKVPIMAKDFGQYLRDENWVCSKMEVKKLVKEKVILK